MRRRWWLTVVVVAVTVAFFFAPVVPVGGEYPDNVTALPRCLNPYPHIPCGPPTHYVGTVHWSARASVSFYLVKCASFYGMDAYETGNITKAGGFFDFPAFAFHCGGHFA
jgi:hypothetical protein